MTEQSEPKPAPARGRRPAQGDPVVDRALALLDAFDPSHRRLTLSELARRSGLPLSTASRLAARLEEWGALHRGPTGAYSIGLRLWEVASLAEPELELRELAAPILDNLGLATRHHVQLAVLEGNDAVVLDRRVGRTALPLNYRVGGRLPVVPTAVGLTLLAFAPPDVADAVLASAFGWPLHECPRPSAHDVRSHLARIRQSGMAVVARPTSPVTSVAVPVHDGDGEVVAALALVFLAGAAEPNHLEPVLHAASLGITRSVGTPKTRPTLPPWRY
jgi:DNA-binding IclR family transcriptional regulator